MSSSAYSDDESMQHISHPSLEQILKENRIKDLALNKATNLIELLNIELQVERNSHQDSLHYLQEDLKEHYEFHIKQLKDRIFVLEQEKINSPVSFSNEKSKQSPIQAIRPSAFNRVNSVKSFNNKKKTINKKYTEFSRNDQTSEQKQFNPFSNHLKHEIIQLTQWRSSVNTELNELVKLQYDELTSLISNIEAITDQYDHIVNKKAYNQHNLYEELSHIVKSQNKLINSLNAYAQELEDMYKSAIFQLASLINNKINESRLQSYDWQGYRYQMMRIVRARKQEWNEQLKQVSSENLQLKNITQSMIKLIQEEKKIKL